MNFKPILFSTPMVKAILDGSKTQTRRKIKYKKQIENPSVGFSAFTPEKHFSVRGKHTDGSFGESFFKVPIQKDDTLWVRETWHPTFDKYRSYFFKADLSEKWDAYIKWKPSIFMPKEACRIFLKVTNVRVERLHDISEEDAIAEGIECLWQDDTGEISVYRNYMATEKDFENDPWSGVADSPQHSFFTLWESINGKESLESNPWVWVYDFERTEKPDNFL